MGLTVSEKKTFKVFPIIHLYMPEFQSNQPKKTHTSPDGALYVSSNGWHSGVRAIHYYLRNLTKIGPLLYFFENVNGRDERWTIGILKPHMSFRAHVS